MLDLVTAIRFDRRMSSGKTKPGLLACIKADGDEVELIAKFSAGCERRAIALAVEGIAAMLAADLDLPIPEPFCVKVDDEFIRTITDPDIAELARNSAPVAFGSKKLPAGFSTFPVNKSIPQALIDQAADIFAFDALIRQIRIADPRTPIVFRTAPIMRFTITNWPSSNPLSVGNRPG
ncbi:MAG: HipA family kinase [Blastocatellia bacterium]